ncbi:MAG: LpxI family protein [Candidatus Binatia bacterium]
MSAAGVRAGAAAGAAAGESASGASGERIGLIAGNGRFPLLFAREARARGLSITAVAHRGETDEAVEGEVDELTWVRVGQLGKLIRTLKHAGVKRAVMAGGIDKARSLTQIRPDLRGMLFLRRAISAGGHGDDSLLRSLAAELEGEGISIVPSTIFLENLLAPPGRLAGPKPSSQALSDIRTGCRVLAALGTADVGQSVVVEHGVVLAVEAVEGTDEAVRRAGRLGRGSGVVVKTAKQGQDMRFDVPAVGPTTIATMVEARACVLAVEAGSTLLLDRTHLVDAATRAGITVVGCTHSGAVAGFSDD